MGLMSMMNGFRWRTSKTSPCFALALPNLSSRLPEPKLRNRIDGARVNHLPHSQTSAFRSLPVERTGITHVSKQVRENLPLFKWHRPSSIILGNTAQGFASPVHFTTTKLAPSHLLSHKQNKLPVLFIGLAQQTPELAQKSRILA